MSEDLVSIIMPCYNGERFITDTIDSVLRQSYKNWELLIIDDGSKDDTVNLVKSKYGTIQNIVVFVKTNSGSSDARNIGLKLSEGRYCAFLDSDDIWHENYLETMIKKIEQCNVPEAAIFFSGYRRMDSECIKPLLNDYSCPGVIAYKDLLRHCPIFPSATMVDREKILKNVFFRKELKSIRDDYVFWLDILKNGLVAVGFEDILVDYRMRSDSMTASKRKMIIPQWNVYRKVLKLNFFASMYYLLSWGLNGIKKYYFK